MRQILLYFLNLIIAVAMYPVPDMKTTWMTTEMEVVAHPPQIRVLKLLQLLLRYYFDFGHIWREYNR